jgi:hypothetical protein
MKMRIGLLLFAAAIAVACCFVDGAEAGRRSACSGPVESVDCCGRVKSVTVSRKARKCDCSGFAVESATVEYEGLIFARMRARRAAAMEAKAGALEAAAAASE